MRIRAALVAWIWLSLISRVSAFSKDLVDIANMALRNSPAQNRFITNKMCPFAQKAWIALEASNTPYEMQEISLYGSNGKPDWFRKLNPAGTVPVLVANGGACILHDSDLILDQLEKAPLGSIALASSDNQEAIREWRSLVNKRLIPVGKRSVLSGRGPSQELEQVLRELDSLVVGPYLTGDAITTADCHAFPFVWRLNDEYGLDQCPTLQQWLAKCSKETPFKKTIQSSWWWWW